MSALEPLHRWVGINSNEFSAYESSLLEAFLVVKIYRTLVQLLKDQYNHYFQVLNVSKERENIEMEHSFISYMVNDVLGSKVYTPQGLAYDTGVPEEVINEISMGINTNPSVFTFLRICEKHMLLRPELYREMVKKIALELLTNIDWEELKLFDALRNND